MFDKNTPIQIDSSRKFSILVFAGRPLRYFELVQTAGRTETFAATVRACSEHEHFDRVQPVPVKKKNTNPIFYLDKNASIFRCPDANRTIFSSSSLSEWTRAVNAFSSSLKTQFLILFVF